jgi:predicted Zn finger-like uncharacterized protein
MSLLTRCPRCSTVFRVTPVQLQARGGKVRCGRCMNVFDGFQALIVEEADAAIEPVRFDVETPEVAPPPSSPAIERETLPRVEHAPPAADATPAPTDAIVQLSSSPARSAASSLPGEPEAASSPAQPAAPRFSLRPAPAEALGDDDPQATAPRTRRRMLPRTGVGWAAACVLALVVLALQLAYAARGELAARYPTLKTMFSSLCATVGCSLSFPHHPELVKIEASDVRMVEPGRPQRVQLTATLRSYAGYYLAYPALDLVLTNANEHALARRVFVPQEYLGPDRDPNAGFPPHAEITIALELDTGNQNAAGFRLDLLAAP